MWPINLSVLSLVAFAAIFFVYVSGYQISFDASSFSNNLDFEDSLRQKREVESFDDYPTATSEYQEEDDGFWDRVVKVALKLFSRFVEWLNS